MSRIMLPGARPVRVSALLASSFGHQFSCGQLGVVDAVIVNFRRHCFPSEVFYGWGKSSGATAECVMVARRRNGRRTRVLTEDGRRYGC